MAGYMQTLHSQQKQTLDLTCANACDHRQKPSQSLALFFLFLPPLKHTHTLFRLEALEALNQYDQEVQGSNKVDIS